MRDDASSFCSHIDDNEVVNVRILLDFIFHNNDFFGITIVTNPRGRRGEKISKTHEYILMSITKDLEISQKVLLKSKSKPLLKTGTESERETGRNCFYPIYVDIKKLVIAGFGEVPPDDFHPIEPVIKKEKDIIEIWPITDDKKERKWRYARQSVEEIKDKLYIKDLRNKANAIYMMKESENFKSVWTEAYHNIAEYGTNLLKNLSLPSEFIYPKSLFTAIDIIKILSEIDRDTIILDFFAGSGTTAHAVMKLNKEDGGKRKFILVEMADYFDTIIIPRMKKIAYSFNWKDGKPQDEDGIGVFFKYQYLEQYEDTLHNIEFSKEEKAATLFENLDEDAKSEYLMKYMLKFETEGSASLLDIKKFEKPFEYKLKIIYSGKREEIVNVDLVETFNYLIGLKVNKYKFLKENKRKYVFVFGERAGKKTVVVWRETKNLNIKEDKDIIEANLKHFNYDEIYINGDNAINNAKLIESEFKALMGV